MEGRAGGGGEGERERFRQKLRKIRGARCRQMSITARHFAGKRVGGLTIDSRRQRSPTSATLLPFGV